MTNYALIADPDVARASSYAALFREEGLPSVIVRDGAFATATLLERGAPYLLLTELSLPRIDGFELIERLRRSGNGDKTPVIVVSASRELRETAEDLRRRLGIGAILAKAASDESVRRVLKRLLTEKRPTPSTPPPAKEAPKAGPPSSPEPAPPQTPPPESDIRTRQTARMPALAAIRRRLRM